MRRETDKHVFFIYGLFNDAFISSSDHITSNDNMAYQSRQMINQSILNDTEGNACGLI